VQVRSWNFNKRSESQGIRPLMPFSNIVKRF